MDRKLIFLDIDGTLTPAGSNVPPLRQKVRETTVSVVREKVIHDLIHDLMSDENAL